MFDLFSSRVGWGCFRECPRERTGLGESMSVARCDGITEVMTVQGKVLTCRRGVCRDD